MSVTLDMMHWCLRLEGADRARWVEKMNHKIPSGWVHRLTVDDVEVYCTDARWGVLLDTDRCDERMRDCVLAGDVMFVIRNTTRPEFMKTMRELVPKTWLSRLSK